MEIFKNCCHHIYQTQAIKQNNFIISQLNNQCQISPRKTHSLKPFKNQSSHKYILNYHQLPLNNNLNKIQYSSSHIKIKAVSQLIKQTASNKKQLLRSKTTHSINTTNVNQSTKNISNKKGIKLQTLNLIKNKYQNKTQSSKYNAQTNKSLNNLPHKPQSTTIIDSYLTSNQLSIRNSIDIASKNIAMSQLLKSDQKEQSLSPIKIFEKQQQTSFFQYNQYNKKQLSKKETSRIQQQSHYSMKLRIDSKQLIQNWNQYSSMKSFKNKQQEQIVNSSEYACYKINFGQNKQKQFQFEQQ